MQSRTLGDEWGFDCSMPLTGALARSVKAAGHEGKPFTFCWRYVFFGPAVHGDLTELETSAILESGLTLMVVQHVRNPGWTASPQLGDSDGAWAVKNAIAAGYTPGEGLALALDLEGVANFGAPVSGHVERWAGRVRSGGFEPVLYVGFQCGLTADELYALPDVRRYWSDAGPRKVSERAFCCKQGVETVVVGVRVDLDHAFPDALGGTLVGMTATSSNA